MTLKAENQKRKGIRMSAKQPVSKEELETVEVQYWVDMLESLERLEKSPDFKKVMLDGYIREKALDSVSLLANPAIKKRNERGDVMEDLVAISNLQYYLRMIHTMGSNGRQDLEEYEESMRTAQAQV